MRQMHSGGARTEETGQDPIGAASSPMMDCGNAKEVPMELDQLRQMIAIEEAGTMSAAADVLSLSQPALSRSVQRLEAELGAELFDRGRNRATSLGHHMP